MTRLEERRRGQRRLMVVAAICVGVVAAVAGVVLLTDSADQDARAEDVPLVVEVG